MLAHQARRIVQTLHLVDGRGHILGWVRCERQRSAMHAAKGLCPGHAVAAVARSRLGHDPAIAARERFQRAPGAGYALAVYLRAHLTQVGRLLVRHVEDFRQDERQPVLAVQADEHRQRAAPLHLHREQGVRFRCGGQSLEQIGGRRKLSRASLPACFSITTFVHFGDSLELRGEPDAGYSSCIATRSAVCDP